MELIQRMWLMSVDKTDRRPVWGDLTSDPMVKNPPYNVGLIPGTGSKIPHVFGFSLVPLVAISM